MRVSNSTAVLLSRVLHRVSLMHFHLVEMFSLVCSRVKFVSGIFVRQTTSDYTLSSLVAISRNVRGPCGYDSHEAMDAVQHRGAWESG